MAIPLPRPVSAPSGAAPTASTVQRGARPGPAPAGPPAKASKLGAVVSGARRVPLLWWFYGDEGIGKSSLVADAPAPIFLDIEGRTRNLHVRRYAFRPEEGDEGTVPKTLGEIEEAIDDLLANPHPFQTAVFDGMAALEALIFQRIIDEARARDQRNKDGKLIENIEDFGFQAGQKIAAQLWRVLVKRFDELRFKRGMHVVLLGHAQIQKYKNPTADDYDCYRPRLDEKATGVLLAQADVIGFITYQDSVSKRGRKMIATSGDRIIHLQRSTTWSAKCCLPLPAAIDLTMDAPWAPFADALEDLYSMTPDGLRGQIVAELNRLGPEFITADNREMHIDAIQHAVHKAGDDTTLLHRFLTGLRQSEPKTATEEKAP